MSKEKLVSLIKYREKHEDLLKAPVPASHANGAEQYKNYLKNEIRMVSLKIDALKLDGVK